MNVEVINVQEIDKYQSLEMNVKNINVQEMKVIDINVQK